jgi:uncharacterized protein YyaL (SSP411 family)
MAGSFGSTPGEGPQVDPALCDHAVAAVLRDEDTTHGGFGGAPKFPPSALLEALLRHWERTGSPQAPGRRPPDRYCDGPGRHV